MSSPDLLPLAVAVLIALPALGSCIGIGLASMKPLGPSGRPPAEPRRAPRADHAPHSRSGRGRRG